MNPERCLRCGRVDHLQAWPLTHIVLGFGTTAVAAMGWRACSRCCLLVEEILAQLEPVAPC